MVAPPCFHTYPPCFLDPPGWCDFHFPAFPPSHIQHPLWIILLLTNHSPLLFFFFYLHVAHVSLGKSQLHLLNCYLFSLLTQDKTLICSGWNMAYLLRKLVRGPDHLILLGHDSASWNRADSASRRGTGSLSGDVIRFVHLHLPKCWRSLFISFWKATCTSFRVSPSWPPSKDLTLQPISTLQFPYIKWNFLMSVKKRHEFIFYILFSFLFEIRADRNWGVYGHNFKMCWMAWAGEGGWGRRGES